VYSFQDFFIGPPSPTESIGDDILNGTFDNLSFLENNDKFNGLAGNDTINGLGGDDILIGDLGNDLLDGGEGRDTASYITASAGVKINLGIIGQQNTVNAGLDTLLNIENIIGTAFNDSLTGNANANFIVGGLGNDIINGGDGFDMASYANAKAGVAVDLRILTQQNTISGGLDTLINIENLAGSIFNDILIGNADANLLNGNSGDDLLIGGGGLDTASYYSAMSGVRVNLGILTKQNTLSAGVDTLESIENLRGSKFNDILIGNNDSNTLNGQDGVDTMNGGLGNDSYVVDNVGDKVIETSLLTTEIDRVFSSVNHSLTLNVENLILIGFSSINGVGNTLNNTIIGNSGNNILNGLDGNDILKGGLGKDSFRLTTLSKDRITDFSVTDDTIQLENSVFT
jgi:Ca2+-binding RTX toxin-like protein